MKPEIGPHHRLLARLRDDRRGSVAIIMALILPIIVGACAIAIDVGLWRYRERALQTAADTAVVAAMFDKMAGHTLSSIVLSARLEAAKNGWDPSRGTLTANSPPTSGPFVGQANALEIIVTSNERRLFSSLYASGPKTLTARAVARAAGGPTTGSGCVMALSETASDAVQLMNNAVINNPDCEVISNSTSSSAIHLNNNAQIAGKATTAGNILIDNGASVGKRVTGASRQHDPYANLELLPSMAGPCKDPMSGGVPQPVNWGSGTINLIPGRWCKGWRASNGATLNLSPGVYFVEQAFDMNNNITINGTGGVTIVVGSGVTPNWSNNTRIRLTAPTTGTTAGLVLTQFTDDTSQRDFNFANNLDFTFTGAIYLPTKSIKVQNNGTLATANGTSGCGHVVAYRVWLSNNATLGNNCAGVGVSPFGTEGSDWAPGGSTGAAIVE